MVSLTTATIALNPNQEMTDFDYKKYSLENLENWLHDALSCGEASPHEIYSVIRKVVQDEYDYHKEKSQQCFGLLELLSGHRPVKLECDKDDPSPECKSAWNDFWGENQQYTEEELGAMCDKASLDEEKERCREYNLREAEYYDKRAELDAITEEVRKAGGYEWTPEVSKKKWVLPVEECKDHDTDKIEYFVTFPDDLLKAANLKEGDQVEWVEKPGGAYLLHKVE